MPALEALSAAVLLCVMLVVLVDVAGRNLLNSPLPWATELVEVLIACLVFALYPVLAWRGNHITVDLIHFHPALQQLQRALSCGIGALLFAVIAYCVGRQAMRSWSYGESSPMLHIPTSLVLWGISVMAAVTALAFLLALRTTFGAASQQPAPSLVVAGPVPHLE
jgi:TRAP-type C4-dicarboxylate transport system permease small subunit